MNPATNPVLELRGITKRFPGVLANDQIDLAVGAGEIRAILGENGAGKSTLMSILYGLVQPDDGEIRLRGKLERFRSPVDAIRAGIGMVQQRFQLFASLTVAENVVYGAEPSRFGFLDRRTAAAQLSELADLYGLEVDLDARVGDLPVGVRQRVEILKTLYRRAELLILDEPTSVLTPAEVRALFDVLRRLAAGGRTILFITHKLEEVLSLATNASVLRSGRVTGTLPIAGTTVEALCRLMVGRPVLPVVRPRVQEPGAVVLSVDGLVVEDEEGHRRVDGVSFEVRAGEVVGIAGVAGNGQTELIEAISGIRPVSGGRVRLGARDVTHAAVAVRREGLVYVPEDRDEVGLALPASVSDNLLLGYENRPELSGKGWFSLPAIRAHARRLLEAYSIKVSGPDTTAMELSGGNRQRLVFARELTKPGGLVIAEQPTRGVDVSAIEFLHETLLRARDDGRAILLVSAELSEILGLSDRILVFFRGRVAGELNGSESSEEALGLLMAGGRPVSAEAAP